MIELHFKIGMTPTPIRQCTTYVTEKMLNKVRNKKLTLSEN